MTDLSLTPPIFSPTDGILFSAYGLDRGYVGYALSFNAACEKLGASHQACEQMLLAFKLNQPRILRVVSSKAAPIGSLRIVLGAEDFN